MNDSAAQRTWLAEVLEAPRDATNLVLGLATGFGVLGLLRPEFSNAPLKQLIDHWIDLSHWLWGSLGELFGLSVPRPIAASLTIIGLVLAMLLRAIWRGYFIQSPMSPRGRRHKHGAAHAGIVWFTSFAVVTATTAMFSGVAITTALGKDYTELQANRDANRQAYFEIMNDDERRNRLTEGERRKWAELERKLAEQELQLKDRGAAMRWPAVLMASIVCGMLLTILFWKAPRAFFGSLIATAMLYGIGAVPVEMTFGRSLDATVPAISSTLAVASNRSN
jgi:hypothetical protein